MPELPEVETVRRGLSALVVGKTIVAVDVYLPRIVRFPSVEEFKQRLVGRTIQNVDRRGKYLLFKIDAYTLVSHLRMEGQYRVTDQTDPMALHTHVVFRFEDDTELRYRDVRQFGTMDLLTAEDARPSGLVALGPEPFDEALTSKVLYDKLHKRAAPIKSVLLDQTVLAGLGNIYVDEALFQANIHPLTSANRIGPKRCAVLLEKIRNVLAAAIEAGGSTIRTYENGYGRHGGFQMQLHVYGRAAQPCLVCGHPIEKIRLGGRGTHFCPQCQSRGKRSKLSGGTSE